jgi:hypothetical protein
MYARLVMAGFIVIVVGTALFSWWFVSGVRRDAAVTDAHVRTVAWAVLAHADRSGGFPTEQAQLLGEPFVPELTSKLAGVVGLPRRASDIGITGEDWADRVRTGLDRAGLKCQDHASLPPTLTAEGRPTGVHTLADANMWIRVAADRLSTASAPR